MAGGLPRSRTYKCTWGALFRQGERQNLGSRVNHSMPPPVKDNDTLAAANNAARRGAASLPPAEAGIKQQPVALEVAVTGKGAPAPGGSEKRETFSQRTQTAPFFCNG